MEIGSTHAIHSVTPYYDSNCLLSQPAYIGFYKTKIGQTKSSSIQLTNTTDYPLKISIYSYDSQFYATKPLIQLEPGETKRVDIVFKPTREGFKSTQVQFNSDSACHGHVVVSGEGVAP